MKIVKASVLTGQGPDRVFLTTDLPSSFPIYPDSLVLQFECAAGTGLAYVRNNFEIDAIDVDVINRQGRSPAQYYSAKGETK